MTQIAVNYAQALYDLAIGEQQTTEILQQLQNLNVGMAAEPAFLQLLTAPNVSKQERCEILDRSFRERVHPYVLNFLKLLTEKGYARHFPDCCKYFEELYNRDNGILPVTAVTPMALTPEQSRRLTEKLQGITGKKILLKQQLDPDCLGGIRLLYDGKQVDGTVKSRLETVGKLLKNTVI